MTEVAAAQQRYRIPMYGGGIDEVDRLGLRDRIRAGEVLRHTEIAPAGSEDWRAASTFPELSRYFELSSLKAPAASSLAPSKPRAVLPMSNRVVQGMLYPLAGGEVFMLLGLAILGIVPFVGWLAAPASTVILVSIVRHSANGKLKMPLVDTSNVWDLFYTWLRVTAITLVSLLPIFAFGTVMLWAMIFHKLPMPLVLAGLAVAIAISAVYYPACLAIVAVWDNIAASLNPVAIVKVIRIIGRDYFIAIAVWFVAVFGTTVLQSPMLGWIPIVGTILRSAISYWALFYAAHVLGYAVYRHAPELGWD